MPRPIEVVDPDTADLLRAKEAQAKKEAEDRRREPPPPSAPSTPTTLNAASSSSPERLPPAEVGVQNKQRDVAPVLPMTAEEIASTGTPLGNVMGPDFVPAAVRGRHNSANGRPPEEEDK